MYTAIDGAGQIKKGTAMAVLESEMDNRLRQAGLTLINSRRITEGRWSQRFFNRIKPRVIIEFYYRLSQTLELGLPILTSLEENEKIITSKSMSKMINEIRSAIEAGNSLFEALSRFPKVFQKLDQSIVRMGEESGTLPRSLKNLAEFLEWKEDIRSTIKRATIYPSFIILAIGGVVAVWIGYVLPQMAGMLKEMGVLLPGTTRAVLGTSLFIQKYWLILLTILGLAIASFLIIKKNTNGAKILHQYLLKIPVIGPVATHIAIARLSQNFATMYSAGLNLNNIFEILTHHVLGNRYLEGQLARVYREVQRGKSIAESFEIAGGFPPLLLGAIRTGETTGTLDVTFARLGAYYNNEVKRSVQTMVNLIEPLSILFLGSIFGLIALSILLPLYDVISKFK